MCKNLAFICKNVALICTVMKR